MRRYDLVVIGTGPAGHHAAIQGAKLGKSVAVVEMQPQVGGAGLNTGTIPSKTLRQMAIALSAARAWQFSALHSPAEWDIATQEMTVRCRAVVQRQVEVYRAQFARNRVELLSGMASFLDAHRLLVEAPYHQSVVEADRIVIATGARPASSEKFPVDGRKILDTDSVLGLSRLPRSMIVVGGGVVGVEYACIFAMLGVSVIVVDQRPRLLDFIDAEIAETLSYHMRDTGVTFRLGEHVDRVAPLPTGGVAAWMQSRKQLRAEALLYAVGRQGNTTGLNLSAVGIDLDERGRIPVNSTYGTSLPNVYAVGDVIGFPGLASVAMEQARLAVCHAFGQPAAPPRLFPYGIYSIPEISFVGQTEAELTALGIPYEVGVAQYREIARSQIIGDSAGRLKLLFHRETGKLLGVHIIGPGAAELVHIGQAVLSFDGSIDYFVDSVFNYPTLAECYKVAALAGMNRMAQWRREDTECATAGMPDRWCVNGDRAAEGANHVVPAALGRG